jgi:serine/threonine-protein kinase
MAPEQARGEPVGPAADVYALGAILFEVLAGEPLHDRRAPMQTTLDGTDGSPRTRAPARDIAPELDAICVQALADDPRTRPTARGFADALQRYLDGDRDQERRRSLAADLVAEARAASAAGDEPRALSAAGRAAAFDPSSPEASRLIVELIVDTSRPPPLELEDAMRADERRKASERSRRAVWPYLTLFCLLPLSPFMHVRDWRTFLLTNAAIAAGAFVVWLNARRSVPHLLMLGAHLVVAVMFTRVAGPFVVTPILICAILLSASTLPDMVQYRWLILLWTLACAVVPLGLEWAGVFAQSWHIDSTGMVSYGSVFAAGEPIDAAVLVVGNIAGLLVVCLFAHMIGRDRRDAERQLQLQLWRFQQLLPRQRVTS